MTDMLVRHLAHNPELLEMPVHRRSRHSVHLRRPDGAIVAEISGAPLHYRDEYGLWRPHDTALRVMGNDFGTAGSKIRVSEDGTVRLLGARFSQRASRFVILDTQTGRVNEIAKIEQGEVVDDSLIGQAGVHQYRLQVWLERTHEELTITQRISGTRAAEWAMLETELTGVDLPDGWLLGQPKFGGFYWLKPICKDATGKTIEARWYAKKEGSKQFLYTGVPVAWLSNASYPVVLDPDLTADLPDTGSVVGGADNYATAHSTGTSYSSGYWSTTGVGQDVSFGHSTNYDCSRVCMRFSTSSLAGLTLIHARLKLAGYYNQYAAQDFDIDITDLDWSDYDPIDFSNADSAYDAALAANKLCTWATAFSVKYGEPGYGVYIESPQLDISRINQSGYTYYGLISSRDVAAIEPIESESAGIGILTNPPILSVTYEELFAGIKYYPGFTGGING